MSPYERRRGGNALRDGTRCHPRRGNTSKGQRGSGHLAVRDRGDSRALTRVMPHPRNQDEPEGKPRPGGVYASQRLSLAELGKTSRGKPRSEPDSGNPIVRDRRGAWGNVVHGGNVNPPRNRKGGDGNPPPTSARAPALSRLPAKVVPAGWLRGMGRTRGGAVGEDYGKNGSGSSSSGKSAAGLGRFGCLPNPNRRQIAIRSRRAADSAGFM